MYQIQLHQLINQIISFSYLVKLWSLQNEESPSKWRIKLCYSIFYSLFPVSLMLGALECDRKDEKIFLIEVALIITVLLFKFLFLIWRKKELLELLNQIYVYGINDPNIFTIVNNQIEIFVKFAVVFLGAGYLNIIFITSVMPFVGSGKTLFLKISFPLDWKNDDFAFWIAFMFIFTEGILTAIALLCSILIWYLIFHSGLRYTVIGEQIRNMGAKLTTGISEAGKVTGVERNKLFQYNLREAITQLRILTELINRSDAFLSKIIVAQLATSGLCICFSIYCLAFNRGDNFVQTMVHVVAFLYNIFDIFMILYFCNELKVGSNRLSVSLFESNWVDRSQFIKQEVFIFGEFLIKPHELVILKLYPLTLDTFTSILKSAYSIFNILQNFK